MSSTHAILAQFNSGLKGIRELFHQTGRLDDSNSKLDEITKLLCLEIVAVRDPSAGVPAIKTLLQAVDGDHNFVERLNDALQQAALSPVLTNFDGESLLGPSPRFDLALSEGELARRLALVVQESLNGHLRNAADVSSFDFMNEAFGHFVRENFRQNIEDAQYMTPQEAVAFMVDLGVSRLEASGAADSRRPVVCDPSCGVGSFLASFYRDWCVSDRSRPEPMLVGQDKVDRMARLSLLNLALFGIDDAQISRGNSLLAGSPLDSFEGQCDLILTNPPFGARFSGDDLARRSLALYPHLAGLLNGGVRSIDSELLFLDRYVGLLRPGGAVLVVLPDSVISAAGLPARLRDLIGRSLTIRSVTELPPVAFAQAGTRTRTAILELTKEKPASSYVVLSSAKSIGFEVSSRKGVPYKRMTGSNDLLAIADAMGRWNGLGQEVAGANTLSSEPSSVAVPQEAVVDDDVWTPSHYAASRFLALEELDSLAESGSFDVHTLGDVARVAPSLRRKVAPEGNAKCISVLHVGDFGALNMRELLNYRPKTAGKACDAGDVLFAKINPRIPRAMVVPELSFEMTCSTEFEVLRPRLGYDAYELMLLLLSENAQRQVRSLTSGTSSSHNRIKTNDLLTVRVAIPRPGTDHRNRYDRIVADFAAAHARMNEANAVLYDSWLAVNSLVSAPG